MNEPAGAQGIYPDEASARRPHKTLVKHVTKAMIQWMIDFDGELMRLENERTQEQNWKLAFYVYLTKNVYQTFS